MNIVKMKLDAHSYDMIKAKTKTVEVRLYDEKRAALETGDLIIFQKLPYLAESQYALISGLRRFDSFTDLFNAYDNKALGCDDVATPDVFVDAMNRYYKDKDKSCGVLAIELAEFKETLDIELLSARRINDRDVEIYFSEYFETDCDPDTSEFTLMLENDSTKTPLKLDMHYGRGGHVHFMKMTTLRLQNPLPTDTDEGTPPVLTLLYRSKSYTVPFEDYYKYKYVTNAGITVRGSATLILGMETVRRAAEMVDIQLSACPQIAKQMAASGATLSIFGRGECAYHIPEHRGGYNVHALYVEGFGGITCSITEANIWHWHRDCDTRPDPMYSTHYHNENIMIHEFGHGVKIAGIDRMEDRSLYTEFQMLYRHAKAAGLWPNTYAISNSDEYFATLSAIWFNVMNECAKDDGWDGTRGPINTRRELYNYDIDAYKFFSKIYPHRNLDGAWTPVPDTVHLTGLKDEPEEDFTGKNFVLPYPDASLIEAGKLHFNEAYKLVIPRSGYVMDTGAAEGIVGVWSDYSGATDDIGAMSFIFEQLPNVDVTERYDENEDETERIYTVHIKGERDGYLYTDGNYILIGCTDREPAVFTVSMRDGHNYAVIKMDGMRLIPESKPAEGVKLKLTAEKEEFMRGGVWHFINIADSKKKLLFIHDGTANESERGVIAVGGDIITLAAMPEKDGVPFSCWSASYGEIAAPNETATTLIMPDSDTVVRAIYKNK